MSLRAFIFFNNKLLLLLIIIISINIIIIIKNIMIMITISIIFGEFTQQDGRKKRTLLSDYLRGFLDLHLKFFWRSV